MKLTPQTYGSTNPLLQKKAPTIVAPQGPTQPPRVATPAPTPRPAPVAQNAPVAPVVAPTVPAPGSVASIAPRAPFSYARTAEDIAADEARNRLLAINGADANMTVNPEQEYRTKLKQYQAQIDATNAVYNDQLNASRVAGQGRLGSSRAMQGRSGLLGSDFGAAQTDTITTANQEADQAVQNERSVAIANIMGMARKDATESVAAKTAAKRAGADALLRYYAEDVPAQRTGRVSKVAKALFDKKLDPSTLTPAELKQLSTDWNVSADDISSAYNDLRTTNDDATAKKDLETRKSEADIAKINADIAKGKLIEISEGTMLYNTETGETYKNPKTYAPVRSGSGAGSADKMLTITEAQNLGVPFGTMLSAVVGQGIVPTGKATGEQNTNFGFYQRAQDATETITPLEDDIAKQSLGRQFQLDSAPNWLQTPLQQSYRQAQRQFTEARLRADSGAAVPDAEYDSDAKTYFAQPGDGPEQLEQKRLARQAVLDAMAIQSGAAFRDYYGTMPIQTVKGRQTTPTPDLSQMTDEELMQYANQ